MQAVGLQPHANKTMTFRVTQYGEPVLRQKGSRIEVFDAELRSFAARMIETMYEAEGVGLAAQQVDRPLQIFVADVSHLPDEELDFELDGKRPPIDLIMPMAFVNPVLRILPGRSEIGEEGCLSFPGIRGDIPRAHSIELEFQDLDGAPHLLRASGWFARVIQHEFDHLQGILFIDHMNTRQLRNIESKLKRLKRESRDFLRRGASASQGA